MKAAATSASNFLRLAASTMAVRLLGRRSVTPELYHRPRTFVERPARLGGRLEGASAEAEREDVGDGAQLLHLVVREGRGLAPEEEPAGRLPDAQDQARLEAALDLLRVLGVPR